MKPRPIIKITPQPGDRGLDSFRGSRCGICYWALYDGDWCQNKACVMAGKSVGENRVKLTNAEAQILINAKT